MPSISYELPAWLIPKGFDAHLERMASLQAMEMGAREQQQKREFALRTDQFRLQQQKANLDMAGQVMSNQMMSDEMEDNLAIQKVFPQWQQGNFDASPEGLKTVKGMTYADRLKTSIMSQNTLGQARIAMDKDATLVIEDDPYNAAMLSQFKPYSAEYAKQLKIMVDTMKSKQEAAFARKQDVLLRGKMTLEGMKEDSAEARAQIRADAMIQAAVDRGASAFEIAQLRTDAQREIADARSQAYEARTRAMIDIAKYRADTTLKGVEERIKAATYHAKSWMGNAQLARYKAALNTIQNDFTITTAAKKQQEMDKVDAEFGVGHTIDQPSESPTGTNAPKVLKWNPKTNNFE